MTGFLLGCIAGAWVFYAFSGGGDLQFGYAFGCTWVAVFALLWAHVISERV